MRRSLALTVCLSITVITVFPSAFGVLPLERVIMDSPNLVNAFGSPVGNNINLNQQVQVSTKITNNQDTVQEFVYIVQIKNENGVIVSLGFLGGIELAPGQSFSPALSWSAKNSGTYTTEVYVWDNLKNQEPLSDFKAIDIIVS